MKRGLHYCTEHGAAGFLHSTSSFAYSQHKAIHVRLWGREAGSAIRSPNLRLNEKRAFLARVAPHLDATKESVGTRPTNPPEAWFTGAVRGKA